MPIGSCLIGETNLSRGLIMSSSRLSDSSDSETECRLGFGQNTVIRSPKKRQHQDPDSPENHDNLKRSRYNLHEDINHGESADDEEARADAEKKASNIGERLMQKMGYSEGTGLGKYGQGRLQPVEAFNQKGRRGLGHDNIRLREAKLKWDPVAEVVDVQEDMLWLANSLEPPSSNDLVNWLALGPTKETIDDEITFCDPNILEQVVNSKSIFDTLDKNEMRRARTRSNPFETIRGAFFLNRAAVKMANIDKACDFMFTYPKISDSNEPLYFADVCAGPGGFSEYVLWKRKWHAKGFGFTLRDSNDFKLDEFYAGSPETFHPFYGPKDDGNVYDPDNQELFRRLIMGQTRGRGVHFMMSDGGFSVEGKENIQEILSKQLYLCQCLVALMIVREGGHFVTKLFDLFTPFSVGLVYLMYRCFRSVCIFKPNTSRPANSERYLICQGKLAHTDDVIQYLSEINHLLLKSDTNNDVMQLVPMDVLQSDENFCTYIKESNDSLGRKQVVGLLKIAAYCEDTTLFEHRQAQMRKECLEYWELPDQSRTIPRNAKPDDRLQAIVGSPLASLLKSQSPVITAENMEGIILNPPCDWYCVPCEASRNITDKTPTFYFGMGRSKVFRFMRGVWEHVGHIELPPDTLIYAEIVTELRGQHRIQRKTTALHIIDAWMLGSEDISRKYLPDRHSLIHKFCEALWKPETNDIWRVRPKELYSLDDNLTQRLRPEQRTSKNGTQTLALCPPEPSYTHNINSKEEPFFFLPNSVIFLRCTSPPWSLYLSRSTGHHYFFNHRTNEKVYNDRRPDSAVASFHKTFEGRAIWFWPNDETAFDIQYLHDQIKAKCPGLLPI